MEHNRPQTATTEQQECDHVIGYDLEDTWAVHASERHKYSDDDMGIIVDQFRFCPKCGVSLARTEKPVEPTLACACGAAIRPGEFRSEFEVAGHHLVMCSACTQNAIERANQLHQKPVEALPAASEGGETENASEALS